MTVVIPFAEIRRTEVDVFLVMHRLSASGPPGKAHLVGAVVDALEAPGQPRVIHFLSIIAAAPGSPADLVRLPPVPVRTLPDQAYLMIEISSDLAMEETLAYVAQRLGDLLVSLFDAAGIDWLSACSVRPTPDVRCVLLAAFLIRHERTIGDGWSAVLGQRHCGSPGMTVERILGEQTLAESVGDHIESLRSGPWMKKSASERMEAVRDWLWDRDDFKGDFKREAKWIFAGEPAPVLSAPPPTGRSQYVKAGLSVAYKLLWPLYLLLVYVLLTFYFVHLADDRTALIAHVRPLPAWLPSDGWKTLLSWPRSNWLMLVGGPAFALLLWARPIWKRTGPFRPFSSAVVPTLAILLYMTGIAFTWHALWIAVLLIMVPVAGLIIAAYVKLRSLEATDGADDRTPRLDRIQALMARENFVVQNHMFTVSRIKPGLLRALALRYVLTTVGANPFVSRLGFLGSNGVIHYGRWMLLRDERLKGWARWKDPGRLVFWSNYDGTWESYVADFVADAPSNVTGLWSNCVGFPHATGLTHDGAENRDRLVRWARRQQQPTQLWYSAYPELTTARIRINAAIRQGLASTASDADARDWLSLFGSRPRPAKALRTWQIPTLVFGGLGKLPYATCHMVSLSPDRAGNCAWMRDVAREVSYGEYLPGQKSAVALGLSAVGLQKLGLPPDAVSTFPTSFQDGMWSEARSRALGDPAEADRTKGLEVHWQGSGLGTPEAHASVDVFIVIYGDTPEAITAVWDRWSTRRDRAVAFHRCQELTPNTKRSAERTGCPVGAAPVPMTEPFGFADGISQPVMRGSPRSGAKTAHNDLVGPGEIVLGYPDSLERIPPSPSIAASDDPHHSFGDEASDYDIDRQRPEFGRYTGDGRRDIGANGTFLVVRELEQDVGAWSSWLADESQRIQDDVIVATGGGATALVWAGADYVKQQLHRDGDAPPTTDSLGVHLGPLDLATLKRAIAAKVMGRWQDGTPLVRYPTMPRGAAIAADNSFRSGAEDPEGIGCPLGAHSRRANPRDTRVPGSQVEIDSVNRHRMLRVGRKYGDYAPERSFESVPGVVKPGKVGTMFMCLNADIERQFEFVQKSWLLNRSLQDLDNEEDPIIGRGQRTMSVPTSHGVIRFTLPPLVTVRGGGYFFMPGRTTLDYLVSEKGSVGSAEVIAPADSPA